MPPNTRTRKAYKAMKDMGISEGFVKPALRNLLKIYENDWAHIEEENYRALSDAVFEMAQPKVGALEEETLSKEPEQPRKRPRLQSKEDEKSPFNDASSKLAEASSNNHKVKDHVVSNDCSTSVSPDMVGSHQASHGEKALQIPFLSHTCGRNKEKEPISPKSLGLPDKSVSTQHHASRRNMSNALKNSGPKSSSHPMRLRDRQIELQALNSASRKKTSTHALSSHALPLQETNSDTCVAQSQEQNASGSHAFRKHKDETILDEVSDFKVPIAVFPPESSDDGGGGGGVRCENGFLVDTSGAKDGTNCRATSSNEMKTNKKPIHQLSTRNGVGDRARPKEDASRNSHFDVIDNGQSVSKQMNPPSPEVVESLQLPLDNTSPLTEVIDITKKQEKMMISLVNEVNNKRPPSFHYIPDNTIFRNAYVNISLDRIGDNHSCLTCSGDCLSLPIPCACSYETGGEFAYTKEGLVKEEFLKECISMNRDPGKHCQYYCTQCPLERAKKDGIHTPCKGHLVRNFIKECWKKCGCDLHCGNRVVQRGISRKLQVFMTPGGKGWGLRTLEDFPRGAFVCEYVGEVLTNAELFDRVLKSSSAEEHSYPVLLDADWAAEGVLKDEEALCLDATYYGNVARFINHRCVDSNLVEIPVEIETPDHHYYHLAFFTTRVVKAREELTWDYGIDFRDRKHPIKAFKCQCGSRFCRNKRRSRFKTRR
ncbi:hypothetical protein DM860_012344 [Cuscuta australis]|uniref:SET domain-containing protein n=1 Tax=Cuscuta australis TaxID=267555 RepID=A0A328DTK6_9ASTE|nr:hypothetical protein DM860_012344 [Cuscuta australis]